jgi:integrase
VNTLNNAGTMVILDLATGLRCSELFALKWCDILWDVLTLLVRRAIVTGIVSDVKTKYSNAGMPLDPALAAVLLNWQRRTSFKKPEDWVFASPFKAGKVPWYPWGVERRHLIRRHSLRYRTYRLAHVPAHISDAA